MSNASTFLERIESKVGEKWPALAKARSESQEVKREIRELVKDLDSSDTSIVIFGSLAREECTAKSDLDWNLLIDGMAEPEHRDMALTINSKLAERDFIEPGPTGTFGKMTFSHDIIHIIGGQEDTNQNVTHRILLLLESWVAGSSDAYSRVRRQILTRYVSEDMGFLRDEPQKIPRFLLNDIVRYWRTMAVDYAYKKRERAGKGWAIRNAKLRMSRKLIFVSGLLTCFNNQRKFLQKKLSSSDLSIDQIVTCLENTVQLTPLEILAEATINYEIPPDTCKQLFGAYNEFLALLDNEAKREHLKILPEENAYSDPVFQEVRNIGHRFQSGLTKMFFTENRELRSLTEQYGVF